MTKEMTVEELEDAIHAVNAQELDLREQKRELHAKLAKLLNEQRTQDPVVLTRAERDALMQVPTASADGS